MKLHKTLVAAATIMLLSTVSACAKEKAEAPKAPAGAANTISWMGYTEGMKAAREAGKPVMMDFYTTWCKYCKMLDESTYKDAEIVGILNSGFIAIKVNAEGTGSVEHDGRKISERDLAVEYKVSGYPTIWFLDQQGKRIAPLPGYSPPEDFKPVLTFITSGAYGKGTPYADYLKTLKK